MILDAKDVRKKLSKNILADGFEIIIDFFGCGEFFNEVIQ